MKKCFSRLEVHATKKTEKKTIGKLIWGVLFLYALV